MNRRIKIFRYIEELDGLDVTNEYREIAEDLGLAEWTPVVWIGRLFTMDNDLGEHWFDNWDLRDEKRADAERLGLDADQLLFIDPQRFEDGRDGPCHSREFRKRFWTDVLRSLELDMELLFDEARDFNQRRRKFVEENPDDREDLIPDLEDRIEKWRRQLP